MSESNYKATYRKVKLGRRGAFCKVESRSYVSGVMIFMTIF